MTPWQRRKGKAPLCRYHQGVLNTRSNRRRYPHASKGEMRQMAWNTHHQCLDCQGRTPPKGPPLGRDV